MYAITKWRGEKSNKRNDFSPRELLSFFEMSFARDSQMTFVRAEKSQYR